MNRMWEVMKPDTSLLRMDLLRNNIFERCQSVLCARPASFDSLFVSWVKSDLVDQSVREQVGNTIYTFSLKDIVPFLYSYLGAQKVAKPSPRRCDEILVRAVGEYKASPELMSAAARLYASDKGLRALTPPAAPKDRAQMKDWQIGVIAVSMREIAEAAQEPAAAAGTA